MVGTILGEAEWRTPPQSREKSDLRGFRLPRRRCRRNGSMRPVVPGLQRRLDEWRQGKRLRRSAGNAVAVAAKSPPGRAGVAATHRLAHGLPAPAPLAPEHREPEAKPAQHRQLPFPVSRRVAHVFLLTTRRPFHTGGGYWVVSLLHFILHRCCEPPVKPLRTRWDRSDAPCPVSDRPLV